MEIASPEFWIALAQIIGVNIVLSGDNAVVIALAARSLPADQQKRAILWGSAAAVVMRIGLTIVAVELLRLPYVKLVGAALLLWLAVQLLLPEDEGQGGGAGATTIGSAIKTILLADLVMSLDNVIAVAAAAKGSTLLLIIGLAVSIPLAVFASRVLLVLMERFPVIITLGAALLGWVAGDMAVTDPIDRPWVDARAAFLHWGAPLLCAVAVVVVGKLLARRKARARPAPAPLPTGVAAAPGHLRRVLLPVDGSEGAAHAVRHFLGLQEDLRQPAQLEVHLLNVQRPLSGDVSRFVPGGNLDGYYRERSETAVAPARELLEAAGVAFSEHRRVGDPGPSIARIAKDLGCDLIMMGTRGLGSHTGAPLGSVARATAELATKPVLLVK